MTQKMIVQFRLYIIQAGTVIGCLFFALVSTGSALVERAIFPVVRQPYTLESGMFDGPATDDSSWKTVPVFTAMIQAGDTPWLRVHFDDYHLGSRSYVVMTSLEDGESQTLNTKSLPIWSNTSAVFNGNQVQFSLYVAPGESGVFVRIDEIRIFDPAYLSDGSVDGDESTGLGTASICGDFDDRNPSSDPRVGRLFEFGGCTGWLVHNGAALTAGHCGNPDGAIMGSVLGFNVPPSDANGATNAPSIDDQYPVTGVVAFESDGEGEDYSVFTLGPNSNTGLRAHIAQDFYHMTSSVPSEGETLWVIGYGLDPFPSGTGGAGAPCCDWDSDDECNNDCNSASQTQQTDTGSCDDCLVGTAIEHTVDTLPANSGSPIIWESNGLAIGIHTHGGCDSFGSDYDNAGTWLGYDPLNVTLEAVMGPTIVWVDALSIAHTGAVLSPFNTVAQAIPSVPNNGQIAIVKGTYPAAAGNTFVAGNDGKAMTLTAPVGPVVIGN